MRSALLLVLTLWSQAPTSSPLTMGETFTITSKETDEARVINVYSPLGLGPKAGPLPVLYMPDGGMAEDFLHVAGLVQVLSGNGGMRPHLLVGIQNTERRRDMTGPTTNDEDKKIAPRVGGSAAFRRFIRHELMPAVKARYATTTDTAIVGESLAGLFVVETALLEPDLFGTYIAIDPSLWWNSGALVTEAPALANKARGLTRRLMLANSSEATIRKDVFALAAALRTVGGGLTVEHADFPSETHATIYHPAALSAFRLLLPPR